jgi:thiol-disulfide isomerase/thioredoxin
VVANLHGSRSPVSSPSAPVVGKIAPTGVYSTVQGKLTRLASLRGTPTLVWFVATWCSSCQAGTQTIAQNITRLSSRHVRVVELELAGDLGQPGPTIVSFGQQFAGHEYSNPDWIWGVASSQMTQTYDPHAYLDIYYLLNAQGKIVYVNGSPSSTMGSLLQAVGALPA